MAGVAANNSQPIAAGKVAAARNATVPVVAGGLAPGSWYDVYMTAVDDPAGNLQTSVTNIT